MVQGLATIPENFDCEELPFLVEQQVVILSFEGPLPGRWPRQVTNQNLRLGFPPCESVS